MSEFVKVFVHRDVIKMVGETSLREGVPLKTAFCTALWAFSKLTRKEKKVLVWEYLETGLLGTPKEKNMLDLETLEPRHVPATVALQAGVLAVLGTDADDQVDFNLISNPGKSVVQALVNGQSYFFDGAAVTSLYADGAGGDDLISNNTALPATLLGGNGDDTIFGGTGKDVILPGNGKDLVYDLLGGSTVLASQQGADRIYVGPNDTVLSGPEDSVVKFFAPGRAPGAGTVSLEAGVVYITPPNGGSVSQVVQAGKSLLVVTTFGSFSFAAPSVHTVAYFGGSGDDVVSFDTKLDVVAYGGLGGNDTLVGGLGRSLLKGGNGNDTLVARGVESDLSGNSGADILIALTGGKNVLRADALDAVFALKGTTILGI